MCIHVFYKKYHRIIQICSTLGMLAAVGFFLLSPINQVLAADVNTVIEADEIDEAAAAAEELEAAFEGELNIIYNDEIIDSYTGKTISELNEMADSGIAYDGVISDNCYYSAEKDRFIYSYQNVDEAIIANVCDGMIVNNPVELKISDKVDYSVYRNGIKQSDMDINRITRYGAYSIRLGGETTGITMLSFQIVGKYSNISYYNMPEGFRVLDVLKDGLYVAPDTDMVDMTDEGEYDITYFCIANEKDYVFHVVIDHTEPVLALSNVNEKGVARGPVDISDALLEENMEILVKRNNETIPYQEVLKESGQYTIDFADQAGNITSYSFTILMYLSVSSVLYILGFVAVFAGVILYSIIARKRLRIR